MFDWSSAQKKDFGMRLKRLRGPRSMAEMGDRYSVTVSYWSKLESGTGSNPSRRLVRDIANGERVQQEWLVSGVGDAPSLETRDPATGYATSPQFAEIDAVVDMVYSMLGHEKGRKALMEMAKVAGDTEIQLLKRIVRGKFVR